MKKFLTILCFFFIAVSAFAQDNSVADSIVGEYELSHQGIDSKVRISKCEDSTYLAQVFWVGERLDEDGNVRLDEKNPDKSLRHTPCDEVILIKGLKYIPEKQKWGETKVYDPTRGIRANVQCWFQQDGTLRVKGSILGFSQSVYWKKVK